MAGVLIIQDTALKSQSLPEQLHFNTDSSRISLGGIEATGFYDISEIKAVYLEFQDASFWEQMLANHNTDNFVLARLRYDSLSFDSVAVQFKGQTSYTKPASEGSEKLSFSIKLNEVIDGQDIDGYNNLNFNNAYQDFSFMKEVLYTRLCSDLVPALKGNYIRLYINGEDWGLYTNIQQLNGDFIEEWFSEDLGIRWRADVPLTTLPAMAAEEVPPGGANWGDGTAALNYLGEAPEEYQKYYTLKDSDLEDPWSYLVKVCAVLNTTAEEALLDSLEKIMNIDATLWFLAQEILFSDDDSYIYKGKMDYYLFVDGSTKRMLPLEFDGNSAMNGRNKEWSPFMNEENENYPLLNILLSVPELRQRYIAHVKTFLNIALDPTHAKSLLNEYDALISPELESDPKIDFLIQDHVRDVNRLRLFFDFRKDFILGFEAFQNEAPEISDIQLWSDGCEGCIPGQNQEARVTARATHSQGIRSMTLHYCMGLTGAFSAVEMNDAGQGADLAAGDGNFTAEIPATKSGTFVRYYIQASANDSAGSMTFFPERAEYDVCVYRVAESYSEIDDLVINELLASNLTDHYDEAGEFDDWIELYNRGGAETALHGFSLSDKSDIPGKWILPDTTIGPGEYLIIWTDDDEEQGEMHSNFKLSANGEEVVLYDPEGAIIDRVVFGEQQSDISYGRWLNGSGEFLQMPPSYMAENILTISEISDLQSLTELSVYPNPADVQIHISCPVEMQARLRIYSSTGRLLIDSPFQDMLDIAHLQSGIYILRMGLASVLLNVK